MSVGKLVIPFGPEYVRTVIGFQDLDGRGAAAWEVAAHLGVGEAKAAIGLRTATKAGMLAARKDPEQDMTLVYTATDAGRAAAERGEGPAWVSGGIRIRPVAPGAFRDVLDRREDA